MFPFPLLAFSATLSLLASASAASVKRGLVFTPSVSYPEDNYIWTRQPSDLTWYYNYGATPSPVFSNLSQDVFEFVPMLWGADASDTSDTSFLRTVKGLIDAGTNISHALSFNEPNSAASTAAATGGSALDPAVAAAAWVANFIPLQELGIRVGLPACTGGEDGIPWLQQMLGNCSQLVSGNCTYDFVPIHWYGNFEGLASHIGSYAAAFPNTSFWVTEYNYDHQDLATSQYFYNTSAEYMDRLSYIERYSFFGAFRSTVSNVGPNAAMLSVDGQLTDIGAWYLGRTATGTLPTADSAAPTSAAAPVTCWARRVSAAWAVASTVVLLVSF